MLRSCCEVQLQFYQQRVCIAFRVRENRFRHRTGVTSRPVHRSFRTPFPPERSDTAVIAVGLRNPAAAAVIGKEKFGIFFSVLCFPIPFLKRTSGRSPVPLDVHEKTARRKCRSGGCRRPLICAFPYKMSGGYCHG